MDQQLVGGQQWHEMMPVPDHDALSRQMFAQSLQKVSFTDLFVGEQRAWERHVKPQLIEDTGSEDIDPREGRRALDEQPFVKMFNVLKRASKDMEFEACAAMVAPQLPEMIAKAKAYRDSPDKLGSLELQPDLKIPAYNSNVHIHGMPGGYHTELVEDDIMAGAIFERAFFIGQWGARGVLCDDMGVGVANWIKTELPDFHPRDILDMGCTNGQSTLPLVDAFPDAKVYGIDVGAPCLRYAHARSEAMGKAVHYRQMNAEKTDFEDESFDVIVSMILLHETSSVAMKRIFKECHRLLRPGGYMLHVDSGHPSNFPPGDTFRRMLALWGEKNNYEPFASRVSELDWHKIGKEAGFAPENMRDSPVKNSVANAPTQRFAFVAKKE